MIAPYQYDYVVVDPTVQAGHTYCYVLEAVNLSGLTRRFGPECVSLPAMGSERDIPDDEEGLDAVGGCGGL